MKKDQAIANLRSSLYNYAVMAENDLDSDKVYCDICKRWNHGRPKDIKHRPTCPLFREANYDQQD